MSELQKMLEDPADFTAQSIAFALSQILDLLGNVLAVEAVVARSHRAQHLGLVLRPGVEIVVVLGAVGALAVGHDRSSKLTYSRPDSGRLGRFFDGRGVGGAAGEPDDRNAQQEEEDA